MSQDSKTPAAAEVVPLAELVIRIGDTRPVILTMQNDFHQTGEVLISNGSYEDLLLAAWVLEFMRNDVGDQMLQRAQKVIKDFTGEDEMSSVDTDDIPF